MGNSSTKSARIDEAASELSRQGNLSERETSSTWYRYGVDVTDVYDVVDHIGDGHMGEVFTVRRKTTGHHTDHTREKSKDSAKDLKELLEAHGGHMRKDSTASASGGKHVRKGSFGGLLGKKLNDESSASSTPRNDLPTPRSESSTPRSGRKSLKGAVHKTAKVIKSIGKQAEGGGDDSDSRLDKYVRSDTSESHEPPKSPSAPKKGIIKTESASKFSHHSTLSVEDGGSGAGSDSDLTDALSSSFRRNGKAKKGVHFQRTFACKTILTSRINKEQIQELVNEIMIMRRLDHPYVLKLYEVYHVKRKIWLVTELCTGGDLSTRKLNEHDCKNVVEQVLRALVYLHRMGVVHRDIKLENILYENHSKGATVRLIDFGLSRTFDRSSEFLDYARTPYTMTPEAAAAANTEMEATDKADVWAVGIITWIMLSGDFPFIKSNLDLKDKDKMKKLENADYHFGITWKGRSGESPNELGSRGEQDMGRMEAEMKKHQEPEFVHPDEIPDDNESNDDCEGAGQSEDDTLPSSNDSKARAKYIKKHVQQVVKDKKKELKREISGLDEIDIMQEVERYTKFGFMKKTILITMANTMDRGDVGKLREMFLKADTNDSGTITLDELMSAFKKITPDADETKVQMLFNGIDRDKSGHIHYAEFLAALAESHGLVTLDRLTEAFDRIDTDGKGYITHDDLKTILGKDYDKEMVDKMIEEGDFKKNNKIDYEELLQLMFSDPVKGDKMAGSISASTSFNEG
eukprot:g14270.t1 g14270   contig9:1504932-1507607(-)